MNKVKWIPLIEKKPENMISVLLSNANDKWVVAGYRDGNKYYNQFESAKGEDPPIRPTHWQPLPNPPQP